MMLAEDEKIKEKQLKIADRCDSCGAQAFVLVKMLTGELMFCGHHYNKHKNKLNDQAYEIIDERHHINEKPSQSSN